MLFNRRDRPSFATRALNFLWPRAGLKRSTRYFAHRIRRIPGSPYAIAAGFASGAAVSMLPFPGFHFLLAGLVAWGLRSSIVASAIGTIVGNPWTFPFIWLWLFKLGNRMMGSESSLADHDISMGYLWEHPLQLLLPMLVGGLPTAIVTWFVFFWLVRRMVARYQDGRRKRLLAAAVNTRARRGIETGSGV